MTGRIASKLTTNSQCTHWVSDPLPPVSTARAFPKNLTDHRSTLRSSRGKLPELDQYSWSPEANKQYESMGKSPQLSGGFVIRQWPNGLNTGRGAQPERVLWSVPCLPRQSLRLKTLDPISPESFLEATDSNNRAPSPAVEEGNQFQPPALPDTTCSKGRGIGVDKTDPVFRLGVLGIHLTGSASVFIQEGGVGGVVQCGRDLTVFRSRQLLCASICDPEESAPATIHQRSAPRSGHRLGTLGTLVFDHEVLYC